MSSQNSNARRGVQASKVFAGVIGVSLIAPELWLNASYIAHGGSWANPMVIAVIAITLAGAASLPLAERVWLSGQPIKAVGFIGFFAIVAAFSFSVSTERSGERHDSAVAGHTAAGAKQEIARSLVADAQNARNRECEGKKDGSWRCRKAENALAEARKGLISNVTEAAQGLEDGMSARLAGVLAPLGISEGAISMYQPMLLPFALLFGGFLFIAAGFSPRRERRAPTPNTSTNTGNDAADVIPLPQRDVALAELLEFLGDRPVKTSGRELADRFGYSRSTYATWLSKWCEEGIIRREDGEISRPKRRGRRLA